MASVRYTLEEFVQASPDEVLGRLAELYSRMGFSSLRVNAIEAWRAQLPRLSAGVAELILERPEAREWHVLLEYGIPLRDRRPDAVILGHDTIFVVEFKVGAESHDSAAAWQVHSYALDLRDFHPGCEGKNIIPILVATDAQGALSERGFADQFRGHTFAVQEANCANLGRCLCQLAAHGSVGASGLINAAEWDTARYSPTPTIIEAAQSFLAAIACRRYHTLFPMRWKQHRKPSWTRWRIHKKNKPELSASLLEFRDPGRRLWD